MANAKKCDRCKNYYDENTKYKTKGRLIGSIISGVATTNRIYEKDKCYDLCDKCLTELFDFLENKR